MVITGRTGEMLDSQSTNCIVVEMTSAMAGPLKSRQDFFGIPSEGFRLPLCGTCQFQQINERALFRKGASFAAGR